MESRRVREAKAESEGRMGEDCFYCDVTRRLVVGLIEARGLQPVDNAIVQDIDDAIDALAEWCLPSHPQKFLG